MILIRQMRRPYWLLILMLVLLKLLVLGMLITNLWHVLLLLDLAFVLLLF